LATIEQACVFQTGMTEDVGSGTPEYPRLTLNLAEGKEAIMKAKKGKDKKRVSALTKETTKPTTSMSMTTRTQKGTKSRLDALLYALTMAKGTLSQREPDKEVTRKTNLALMDAFKEMRAEQESGTDSGRGSRRLMLANFSSSSREIAQAEERLQGRPRKAWSGQGGGQQESTSLSRQDGPLL